MRDDVQERLTGLGRAAERAAGPVAFDRIRARARRRRRAQALSAAALCVAVAAGIGVTAGQAGGPARTLGPVHHGSPHPSPPVTPSPTVPSPTRTQAAALTAQQIAEDPRSFVVASSVFPGDTGQAATLWELGPAGRKAQFALTTTVDGYRHVRYVPLPSSYGRDCNDVRAVGAGLFWLSCGSRQLLVGSDGAVTVPTRGAPASQMPRDAVLVSQPRLNGKGANWNWFDAQGVMHALDVPLSGSEWLVQAPDGRIWGIDYSNPDHADLVWSTDGGRGWTARPLPRVAAGGSTTYEVVPTAEPGQMVVARGSAETVFRPHSLLRYGRATELHQKVTRVTFSTDPGVMDSAVVTPDGSLVMELYNEPHGDSGLYRAAAGHWTDLHKVMDLPTDAAGRPAGSLWMGNSVNPSGKPSVWVVFTSGMLATSTDDGQTWTTRSLR